MLPAPPTITDLRDAGLRPEEVIDWHPAEVVWRLHRTTGTHVLPWNGMRTFGPILRFDHHPPPRAEHPGYGIWYGATSPAAPWPRRSRVPAWSTAAAATRI